jgi:hypothetical protein
VLLAGFVVGSGSANATGTKCDTTIGTVCVTVANGQVQGHIYNVDPTDTRYLYVVQCRGDGTSCGTIAATSYAIGTSSGWDMETSPKASSFGHIYKACGSFTNGTTGGRYTNLCSPPVAA